jgi:1-acyl-sn-glycerol-3-phosphate acyltransferase
MKREIFWIPFFGWAIAAMEPIAIDRSSGRRAVAQIVAQGIKKLKEGRWIVVFPEGTRVPPGKKARYGQGGAILATESGFPAIPVAHNAGEFWKRNDFIKYPGTIDVVIGKPIESKNKSATELNSEIEGWIEAQMEKISITPYTGELHKRKSTLKQHVFAPGILSMRRLSNPLACSFTLDLFLRLLQVLA